MPCSLAHSPVASRVCAGTKLVVCVATCLLATRSSARAQQARADGVARSPELARGALELRELPLRLHLYTRQVQLGSLRWAVHPCVALAAEYPALRAGTYRFFTQWQLGFEHHAGLQQRFYAGVAPSLRVTLPPYVAFQLSVGVSALRLRSLWTPYHFDGDTGRWAAGESESKWSWLFEADLTAWINLDPRLSVGIGYGVGAIYPFASANEVPALPLTRLGLFGRWVYGA